MILLTRLKYCLSLLFSISNRFLSGEKPIFSADEIQNNFFSVFSLDTNSFYIYNIIHKYILRGTFMLFYNTYKKKLVTAYIGMHLGRGCDAEAICTIKNMLSENKPNRSGRIFMQNEAHDDFILAKNHFPT